MLRIFVCVVLLLSTLALALLVGDEEYHATAVGWAPFIACVAIIIGAFIYLQILARGLRFKGGTASRTCRRGESAKIRIRFENPTPLFFFHVEVHIAITGPTGAITSHAVTTLSLAAFEKYDLDFTARFDHVGSYRVGVEYVLVSDFVRLFNKRLPGTDAVTVEVAPKIFPLERIMLSTDSLVEIRRALRSVLSDSMDYAGVRDYERGDSLKRIHWKLSARMDGSYVTRLYEVNVNPGVTIVMDFCGLGRSQHELMDMFDTVIETAFSIFRYATLSGMDAELRYRDRHGKQVTVGQWLEEDLMRLVEDMPAYTDDKSEGAATLDVIERATHGEQAFNNLVVCSGHIVPELASVLVDAKGAKVNPLLFAVTPRGMEGRERERWLEPLGLLEASDIGVVALSRSEELEGMSV